MAVSEAWYCLITWILSLQRWTRDKSLSFVPPDGHFTLVDYQFAPAGSTIASSSKVTGAVASATSITPVPILMKAVIENNEFGGRYSGDLPIFSA